MREAFTKKVCYPGFVNMAPSWFKIILLVGTICSPGSGEVFDCNQACPPFWTLFNRYCYRYFGQRVTWEDANYNCQAYGSGKVFANLVSIHSREENSFVSNLFKSNIDVTEPTGGSNYMWIGLTDQDDEGSFVWSDGSPVDFILWGQSEPNGGTSEQGVCIAHPKDQNFPKWYDVGLSRTLRYTCKMPVLS